MCTFPDSTDRRRNLRRALGALPAALQKRSGARAASWCCCTEWSLGLRAASSNQESKRVRKIKNSGSHLLMLKAFEILMEQTWNTTLIGAAKRMRSGILAAFKIFNIKQKADKLQTLMEKTIHKH